MSRVMLALVLSACSVAMVVAGCGAVPAANPDDPRLQVTEALRQACDGVIGDAEIRQGLVAFEVDRKNGISWTGQVAAIGPVVAGDPPLAECFQAMVDQAYGVN